MAQVQFFPEAQILTAYMHEPEPLPYEDIVRKQAPWATDVVEVPGGWKAHDWLPRQPKSFVSADDVAQREDIILVAPWAADVREAGGGWWVFEFQDGADEWDRAQ